MILRKMTIKRRESGNTFLCGITTFICVILLASCTSSASFFARKLSLLMPEVTIPTIDAQMASVSTEVTTWLASARFVVCTPDRRK